MATTLGSARIGSPSTADAYFRRQLGLLVAQPMSCWNPCLPIAIVPEGYHALVTRCGAEIPDGAGNIVHQSGWMIVSPFTSVSHLVTRSHCVFNAPIKGCKTLDNVQVNINVAVIFRIVNDRGGGVRFFVHEVTPGGLEQQLKDSVAQELRALARSMRHTEVYACRTGNPAVPAEGLTEVGYAGDEDDGAPAKAPLVAVEASAMDRDEEKVQRGIDVTEAMKVKVNATLDSCVEIVDISITDVELPQNIAKQMTGRTMVRSKQAYEVMEQKFAMLEIKCSNEVEQLRLNNDEREAKQRAVGAKDVQALKDELEETRVRHRREETEYAEQTAAEVHTIEAATKEQAGALALDQARVLDTLRLAAQEEAARAEADADADVARLRATTDAAVARDVAEAETAVAAAEARADEALRTRRALDVAARRLDVYAALAANPDVVVTDARDPENARLLVSDSVLSSHAKAADSEESLVARLNVLRLASNALGMRSEWTGAPAAGAKPKRAASGLASPPQA